jgi:hypothetical protein
MNEWVLDDLSKIRDVINRLENYDPVLFSDVIEFMMDKARGLEKRLEE